MRHVETTTTEHTVTFDQQEATRFGEWLLEVSDAMVDDMVGRLPNRAADPALRELIGQLANHLNGVE